MAWDLYKEFDKWKARAEKAEAALKNAPPQYGPPPHDLVRAERAELDRDHYKTALETIRDMTFLGRAAAGALYVAGRALQDVAEQQEKRGTNIATKQER